jgi:SET domain-containing protein
MEPPAESAPAYLETFGVPGARGVRTTRAFRAGEVVCAVPVTAVHDRPSRRTVQVGAGRHVEVGFLSHLNHSCDPNVILDTDRMVVRAARDLAAGDELRYFYPSTEWEMAEPFTCRCGSAGCLGVIRGAGDLPADAFRGRHVSAHVRALREARAAGGAG